MNTDQGVAEGRGPISPTLLTHELHHLAAHWLWLLLLGILLAVAGTAAVIIPAATVGTTLAVTIVLGTLLMVGGVATIVSSFWIGRWSGFLVQLLVGLIYVACGFVMTEKPVVTAVAMTVSSPSLLSSWGCFAASVRSCFASRNGDGPCSTA